MPITQRTVSRQPGNDPASLRAQAQRLRTQGELDRALALFMEEERIHRGAGSPARLAGCLFDQAMILCSRQRFEEALPRIRESYRLTGGLEGYNLHPGVESREVIRTVMDRLLFVSPPY